MHAYMLMATIFYEYKDEWCNVKHTEFPAVSQFGVIHRQALFFVGAEHYKSTLSQQKACLPRLKPNYIHHKIVQTEALPDFRLAMFTVSTVFHYIMKQRPVTGTKEELRNAMRAERLSLPANEREALSAKACALVLSAPEWEKAEAVALYMAVRGEADCGILLHEAWAIGKAVLLPFCSGQAEGEMLLAPCSGVHMLKPGAFSIPEPALACESRPALSSDAWPVPDLILVPGLAFDQQGNRLGMGGGYYDRLLAKEVYGKCFRLGFAYSFQLVDHLPADRHDIPVHAVCTDLNFTRV